MNRQCLECGATVVGRADKKFCDSNCRVLYHNRTNVRATSLVRAVNNVLRKNRRILAEIYSWRPDKKTVQVDRDTLLLEGLHFGLFTSEWCDSQGLKWSWCYDFGYAEIGNNSFVIAHKVDLDNELSAKAGEEQNRGYFK